MIVSATPAQVQVAAQLIRSGETVAFPTETVYGLGADATNATAVAQIFAIKARPAFDPLIVHIDVAWWSDLVLAIPPGAAQLAHRFWPGPLTIVLPKTDRVPDIVTAGLPNVAIRVPDHRVARALITRAQLPIAAPSANPFGYISPTTAEHVAAQIGERIPLILDGGPCRVGLESTVISFVDDRPALLRPGAVTREQIEALIGPIDVVTSSSRPMSPGQLDRHYAPRTPLTIVDSIDAIPPEARAGAALLTPFPLPREHFRERGGVGEGAFAHIETLADDATLTTAAANLFAALRRLDSGNYKQIYAVALAEEGIGRAIMDRLRRASWE